MASTAMLAGVLVAQPQAYAAETASFTLSSLPMNQAVSATTLGLNQAAVEESRLTDQKPSRKPRSQAELQEIGRPGKYVVSAENTPPAGFSTLAEFSPVDDPITATDCANFYNHAPVPAPDHWYKNRFNACYGRLFVLRSLEVRNGKQYVKAAMQVKVMFMVSMNRNARSANVTIDLSDWFDAADNFPMNQKLAFGAGCWDPNASGPECDPDSISRQDTLANWKSNSRQTYLVNFPGTSAPLPNDPALNEKRSYYEFDPYFYIETGIPNVRDFETFPAFYHRCDVARTVVNPQYVRGSDCVFHEASGIFQMYISDTDVTESAQFIRDAQNDISLTKPGTLGSYVPGKFQATAPLTRLYYDSASREANRLKSIATCVREFGPNYPTDRTDGKSNDCDEYPFATTHEGSYFAIGNRSYAVRALLSAHNSNAGNQLSQ